MLTVQWWIPAARVATALGRLTFQRPRLSSTAAAGLRVAKHGNRAASGKVGAADVMDALGAEVEVGPEQAALLMEEVGIAFLFAPRYHPAVRHVGPARKECGFRTIFNLTGPLSNPAGATRQVVGLFSPAWLDAVAGALDELGSEHVMVVHGTDGSDEITPVATTRVVELNNGQLSRYEIDPGGLRYRARSAADLLGGSAEDNADMIRGILAGEKGPRGRCGRTQCRRSNLRGRC